jgi:hypothetical protein
MRHTSLFFQHKQHLKTDKEISSAIKAGVVTEKTRDKDGRWYVNLMEILMKN